MIQNVGLSYIIENSKYLKLYIEEHCHQWMENGPWFNKTIFSQLNGQNFEDYLKTGRKDRYELMCDVDVYEK